MRGKIINNLSLRLTTIADFIHEKSNVIDVGADHGLLEKTLIEQNKVNYLQAVENKKGPYDILVTSLAGYKIDISLSDGLDLMNECVNTIVIAGMGGTLITKILEKNKHKLNNIDQIVVDAHRDVGLLRRYIVNLGYMIEKEKIVYEKSKYYFIISFIRGYKHYSDVEFEYGYNIKNDLLFNLYKNYELNRLNKNLNNLKNAKFIKQLHLNDILDKIEKLKSL